VIKGGATAGQQAPYGIHITTSVYGKAIKLVYGLGLVGPDLIWYNNWEKSSSPSNSALYAVTGGSTKKKSGGGGKKGGKSGSTSYYSASVDFVLGHAPIIGVLAAYYQNQKFACPIQSASGVVADGAFSWTPPTGGIVAGVVAVTVAETYSATFNDYGGPGEITQSGTWQVPLWNQQFAVPGNIDPTTAFNARDPYSYAWDGADPIIAVPSALNGKTVTVYYGVPQILYSDGNFYSSHTTPLALLNLELELACGSGSEYATQPSQQVINTFCAGVGSVKFDLGAANAIPNLNLECIGAFTLWPNGDCDIADIITDLCMSGPVLVGG
jgi:hypothetical protein